MKKFIAMFLSICVTLGLCTVAFAANPRITGIIEAIDLNNTYVDRTYTPGETIWFPLTADMFSWSDGSTGTNATPVTQRQLDDAKITIRTSSMDSNIKVSFKSNSKSGVAGGKSTAGILVEFADRYVSLKEKSFKPTIYLAVGSNRSENSKLVMNGKFANKLKEISNSDGVQKAVDSSGIHYMFKAKDNITAAEIEAGEGVFVTGRMYQGREYYLRAWENISYSDEDLIIKYDIYSIIQLDMLGFTSASLKVKLEDHDGMYVYNAQGAYLGRASNTMAFSEKYYITEKRYESLVIPGSGTSSGSSSSSSIPSTSSSTVPPAASGNTPNAQGSAITAETVKARTATAAQAAKASGLKTATVKFQDTPSISAAALRAMPASAPGLAVSMIADTLSGKAVAGRLTINPANAANLTGDIKLGVYVDSASTSSTKAFFEKWFSNKIAVVSTAHKGSYGMGVRIAAKVDISALNKNSLYFYLYDQSANTYTQISNANAAVDSVGYLHFSTSSGGEIIITDKALVRK